MKAMETLQDLIEEAKLRTVWWALCIFAISYFLSRKSSHSIRFLWMIDDAFVFILIYFSLLR